MKYQSKGNLFSLGITFYVLHVSDVHIMPFIGEMTTCMCSGSTGEFILHDFMPSKPLGSHFPPLVLFYHYEKSLLRTVHISISSYTLILSPATLNCLFWPRSSYEAPNHAAHPQTALISYRSFSCALNIENIVDFVVEKKEKRDLLFR